MTVLEVPEVQNGTKGPSIPVLNISKLLQGRCNENDAEYRTQAADLLEACHEFGFAQLVNHGIAKETLQGMVDEAQSFFEDAPSSCRDACRRNSSTSRGFADDELTKQKRDQKWIMDIGSAEVDHRPKCNDENNFSEGPNQWPDDKILPKFKSTMQSYMSNMTELSLALLEALEFVLGSKAGRFHKICDCSNHSSFLRLNYYPAASEKFEKEEYSSKMARMGVHDHKDAGLLTVLWQQEEQSALQAWHRSSSTWLDVVPHADALVLNAGDMLQVLTNDRVYAPPHRVVLRPEHRKKTRISAPFFYNPGFGALIEPLDVAQDKANYKPLSWAHFRRRRIAGDFADEGTEIQIEHFRTDLQ